MSTHRRLLLLKRRREERKGWYWVLKGINKFNRNKEINLSNNNNNIIIINKRNLNEQKEETSFESGTCYL